MRRFALLVAVALLAVACSSGGSSDRFAVSAESVKLPFGLRVVDGTEPIGRPAVYEDVAYFYDGEPIRARMLRAAFAVTSDDPLGVVRAWVAQLDELRLDDVQVRRGEGGGLWMEASGYSRPEGEAKSDSARLQLWATSEDPILLVSIDRSRTDVVDSAVRDEVGTSPPRPKGVRWTIRHEGASLFTEQGTTMHLPDGATSLMPTLPTAAGTGGSTSVIAAPDVHAAISALLEEARRSSEYGEITGPVRSTFDDVEVESARFVIPAGGWGFQVVAVRAPGDEFATLFVTSAAD